MRKIKFKVWLKKEKEMYSPLDFTPPTKNNFSSKVWVNVDNNTILLQFTGLYDKNGKEIYEGDILGGIWEAGYFSWCDKCKQFQYFNCLAECMACEGEVNWYELVEDKELEVIGNIFENPELLNKI